MLYSDIFGALGPIWDEMFVGVIIIDNLQRIIYYNKALGAMDELEPEEVLGYTIPEVYSVRGAESPIVSALSSKEPLKGRYLHYKTTRGRQINSLNHAYPIFYNGVLYGAICIVTDISSLTLQVQQSTASHHKQTQAVKIKDDDVILNFENIIGKNPVFREALEVAKIAASGPSSAMLIGETGTGKDLIAKAIHNYSKRSDKPFIAINCSAIPESLLEGILFGTSKGAFTGAIEKEGLLEHASGGTVFLDEINSMPISLQAKLLRVIQDHKVRRVGGLVEKKIDLRVISSSNINPLLAIENQTMRSDLYYRLGVIQVTIPPLRERPEDIPPLAKHFIKTISKRLDKTIAGISTKALSTLRTRNWPGNVRELEHTIESALNFVSDGEQLDQYHLKRASPHVGREQKRTGQALANYFPALGLLKGDNSETKNLRELLENYEKKLLNRSLQNNNWRLNLAAAELGLSPQLMSYKVKKFKLNYSTLEKQ